MCWVRYGVTGKAVVSAGGCVVEDWSLTSHQCHYRTLCNGRLAGRDLFIAALLDSLLLRVYPLMSNV